MNIGITCYPVAGGSGIVATELGQQLALKGHQVHFIAYALPFRLDRYQANVSGAIEAVNGVLKITRINVDYTLKIDADKRETAREVFETYLPGCPAAQSVIGCIEISHRLNMSDR